MAQRWIVARSTPTPSSTGWSTTPTGSISPASPFVARKSPNRLDLKRLKPPKTNQQPSASHPAASAWTPGGIIGNRTPMNRPTPSLAILAIVAVAPSLIVFVRQYLWPQRSERMGGAAVAGYTHQPAAQVPDQDDAATVGGMIDAGRMWAKVHHPNSAAGCPAFPAPIHKRCADATAANP
jgi:hypothetical protein